MFDFQAPPQETLLGAECYRQRNKARRTKQLRVLWLYCKVTLTKTGKSPDFTPR